MDNLNNLHKWLTNCGLMSESREVRSLIKTSGSIIEYTVKEGDVLGSIAETHRTTVSKIRKENNLPGTTIRVGQVLKIPTAVGETEIVAMTLLGEGGSLDAGGASIMKEIMSVILNRADATGKTLTEVVKEPLQFSFWNGRSEYDTYSESDAYGLKSKNWTLAYSIAEERQYTDKIGCSTHYWAPAHVPTPAWAKGDKFQVIFTGSHHIYGIMKDGSKYAKFAEKNCGKAD